MNPHVTEHTTEAAWLAARQIGCSDIASILDIDIDQYDSPYTTFMQMTGKLPRKEATLSMMRGHAMEPHIAAEYERITGVSLIDPGDYTVWTHPEYPFWTCTPDRLIMTADGTITCVVELKDMGQFSGAKLKHGEPPMAYQVQLQSQMAVMGLDAGELVIACGNDLHVFPYARHDALIEQITARVVEFHERLVNNAPPPVDGTASTTETLKLLYPVASGETVVLPDAIALRISELGKVKERIKALEAEKDECENVIRAALGDATYGDGGPLGKVSYKTTERAGVLRVDPEYAATLAEEGVPFTETKASKYRVLRVTKGA